MEKEYKKQEEVNERKNDSQSTLDFGFDDFKGLELDTSDMFDNSFDGLEIPSFLPKEDKE